MHGYVDVVESVVENHEKCKCQNHLVTDNIEKCCCLSHREDKLPGETGHLVHHKNCLSPDRTKNSKQVRINCTGSSLDTVLNSVPLVYDPVTKQLFLSDGRRATAVPKSSSTPLINDGTHRLMGDGLLPLQDSVHCKCLKKLTLDDHGKVEPCKSSCVCRSKTFSVEDTDTSNARTTNSRKSWGTDTNQNDESDYNGSADDAHLLSVPPNFSLYTDTSSVTSISSISTGTEASAALSEYTEGSDNPGIALCDSISQSSRGSPWKGAKPKRKGISSLLSRNLFPWKSKENNDDSVSQTLSASPEVARKSADDCVASSTTALILENRPAHLPAKSYEEELKHKQEYEEMVKAARKKEIREAKLKKKQLQQLRKQEDMLIHAIRVWTTEILPQWDAVKDTRKARDLWWQGIPPNVRGKVWKLAIGNDLNITPELFDICVTRSKEKIWTVLPKSDNGESEECSSSENSADLIKLDVSRTFPMLGIFQESGPYHDILSCVLGAYVTYRPDIGYVQGMSFLAAMLLLNMESVDAFTCFANLLNKPCHLCFFRVDESQMKAYYEVYEDFFSENLPKLFAHFNKQNLSTDLYLVDWIYTLYSRSLPLDVASRVWDVFFRDGEEFMFRAALGILRMYEDVLLQLDFIHIAQFLNKLPDDICSEQLFASISAIKMTVNKKQFSQTLLKRQAELVADSLS